MTRYPLLFIPTALALGLAPGVSRASVTSVAIGSPHFADGATPGSGTFIGAVSAQPAPFNSFIGGDVAGPDFLAVWTLNFTPTTPVASAWIELGIYDHDTRATGAQVADFRLFSSSLTTEARAVMEARGGGSSEYNIYTIPIPAALLPQLAGGTATFTLALQAPGLGVLGETAANGAGIDFVRLSVSDVVPEPESAVLVLAAASCGLLRRQRPRKA